MKPRKLTFFGVCCMSLGFLVLTITYLPVIRNEINYSIQKDREVRVVESLDQKTQGDQDVIVVKDKNFGLVIPKIRANASIVPNVDPNNQKIYQKALTKGVAHALGTSLPSENGNTFLFSHSSNNFFEANKYNSIFYMLYKLESGDEIYVYQDGSRYEYVVSGMKIVKPSEVIYMESEDNADLTLMTCWPAGTSYKRLVVMADQTNPKEQVD